MQGKEDDEGREKSDNEKRQAGHAGQLPSLRHKNVPDRQIIASLFFPFCFSRILALEGYAGEVFAYCPAISLIKEIYRLSYHLSVIPIYTCMPIFQAAAR
jgi:hypothetical protein